jgi:hypothetical protein
MAKGQLETRDTLMARHRELLTRRAKTPLGSPEYQRLAEEIAAVEVEIARIEEPPVELLGKRPEPAPRRV